MKRIALILSSILLAACTTFHPSAPPETIPPQTVTLSAEPTTVSVPVPATDDQPTAEQNSLLRLQDRLNIFASPKYVADVQAAKAAGSDATQNACMDVTVEIGADLKAKPLIVIPSVNMTGVDPSCGWCVLAAKRKLAAEIAGGPSLLTQLADARKRVLALARKGLVGCASLKEDMRLQLLTPENTAADLLTFLNLVGER